MATRQWSWSKAERQRKANRERERLEVEVDNGTRVPRESCLPFRHCQGLRIQRIDIPEDSSVSFQFHDLSSINSTMFDHVWRCLKKEEKKKKENKNALRRSADSVAARPWKFVKILEEGRGREERTSTIYVHHIRQGINRRNSVSITRFIRPRYPFDKFDYVWPCLKMFEHVWTCLKMFEEAKKKNRKDVKMLFINRMSCYRCSLVKNSWKIRENSRAMGRGKDTFARTPSIPIHHI